MAHYYHSFCQIELIFIHRIIQVWQRMRAYPGFNLVHSVMARNELFWCKYAQSASNSSWEPVISWNTLQGVIMHIQLFDFYLIHFNKSIRICNRTLFSRGCVYQHILYTYIARSIFLLFLLFIIIIVIIISSKQRLVIEYLLLYVRFCFQ